MHKTALIWDLDGTLWDACDTVAAAWNGYCSAHGLDRSFSADDCRRCCGKTLAEIAALLFPDEAVEARETKTAELFASENPPLALHGGMLFPGALEILEDLHSRFFMAVVSNCGAGYVEAFFEGNRTAKFFDDYENPARTGLDKGDNIRLVMARNSIERAVYIGDTDGDFRAARKAGVPFVHAAYGFGEVPEAEFRAERFSDLPELIRRILGLS